MEHRVLIADDDPRTRKVLEHHLGEAGYHVIGVDDGEAALAQLTATPPSLAVIDWDLPRDAGAEVCRRLRAAANGTVYTVLLTSERGGNRLAEAYLAGADDYLIKPFRKDELLARLRAGARIVELEQSLACTIEEAARYRTETPDVDPLTELPMRDAALAALGAHWDAAVAASQPMACILIGLDSVDPGGDVTDVLIARVAHALERVTRGDEQAYRLAADEFLLICPAATTAQALRAADRLRAVFAAMRPSGVTGASAVSIAAPSAAPGAVPIARFGVAERTAEMTGADGLLAAARDALRDAGREPGSCVRTAPSAPIAMPTPTGDVSRRASA